MQLKILVKLISFSGPIKANGYQMVRQKYLSTGCPRKKKKENARRNQILHRAGEQEIKISVH